MCCSNNGSKVPAGHYLYGTTLQRIWARSPLLLSMVPWLVYNGCKQSFLTVFMMSLPDILLPKIRHFGLSVERHSLHAVEVDGKGKPVRTGEIQLEEDTFVDGKLVKQEQFIRAMHLLLDAGKFSTSYTAVTFPEVFAYTRGYTVSSLEPEEIQEAISWHSKDLFPFPPDDLYFDWKELTKNDHETQAVVQKATLDPLLEALAEAGLTPLRFEPDASALARLLANHSHKHTLLIDVNPRGAYVTLVEGEKALFTTVVNYSEEDTPDMYLANIDQTLKEIADFYKTKGIIDESSTEIVVTGQMASNDWVSHVSQLLNYKATLLLTGVEHPRFNKAFAAALEKIAPPIDPDSINLMPVKFQKEYDTKRMQSFYSSLLMRALIVILVVALLTVFSYVGASIMRQTIDGQVKAMRKLTQTQATNTQSLLLLNSQAKNIVALGPLRITPRVKVESLSRLLSDKLVVNQWEYDDAKQEMKISGIAQTRDDLLNFKNSIDASTDFGHVTLPLGSLETPISVPFTLTFLIRK
jgi:Tfp pilus assembly PilM family ATPase